MPTPKTVPRRESLDLVAKLLQESEITCANILERACEKTAYQVTPNELRQSSKKPMIVAVRDAVIYVLRERLQLSNVDIGKIVNRDPADVIYAIKKLKPYVSNNANGYHAAFVQEGLQWRIR